MIAYLLDTFFANFHVTSTNPSYLIFFFITDSLFINYFMNTVDFWPFSNLKLHSDKCLDNFLLLATHHYYLTKRLNYPFLNSFHTE